ncbi:ImuA family protein [Mucilaginibacter myungsuensis]|uniref:Error-prone repair protein ImuA n=1 Tax=Mucilaginibacter myungsuensis TaxID=649104 RepID=A0A929PX03_9SPHI|nr:Error-prone repair protein ImuA [Mucilaginibacter myungsuensis]MBE9662674.1 Error-prone repair protein ImuA [Mucilaginibacter myungsuensis]MDN3598094.1 Error-prone repair protein ImuA [Mucilaginibacter myungsuensis]
MPDSKKDIIARLQQNILRWEGFVPPPASEAKGIGLGPLEAAFPNGVFPTGAMHEMLCPTLEGTAATGGLLGGILSSLMQKGGTCLWIGSGRKLFPHGMTAFNIEPHRIVFVDLPREKDILWATEEALKCEGLAAVVAEVKDISFALSRRLQLAVEHSKITGFLLRSDMRKLSTTTCVARWQVTSVPSQLPQGMPGVGHPRWQAELLRVRNGTPGSWEIEWVDGKFVTVEEQMAKVVYMETRIAG